MKYQEQVSFGSQLSPCLPENCKTSRTCLRTAIRKQRLIPRDPESHEATTTPQVCRPSNSPRHGYFSHSGEASDQGPFHSLDFGHKSALSHVITSMPRQKLQCPRDSVSVPYLNEILVTALALLAKTCFATSEMKPRCDLAEKLCSCLESCQCCVAVETPRADRTNRSCQAMLAQILRLCSGVFLRSSFSSHAATMSMGSCGPPLGADTLFLLVFISVGHRLGALRLHDA